MAVLVTGGAGYIGSETVVVLDSMEFGHPGPPSETSRWWTATSATQKAVAEAVERSSGTASTPSST